MVVQSLAGWKEDRTEKKRQRIRRKGKRCYRKGIGGGNRKILLEESDETITHERETGAVENAQSLSSPPGMGGDGKKRTWGRSKRKGRRGETCNNDGSGKAEKLVYEGIQKCSLKE